MMSDSKCQQIFKEKIAMDFMLLAELKFQDKLLLAL